MGSDSRIVVGIDFGTTFTSVAFGHTAIPDAVKLVQSWSNHRSADQVPTEIHYTCSEGAERNYTWGYEVPKGGNESPQTLKWFKLLLQNSARSGSGKPPPGTPSSSCSESGGPTSYFGATLSRAFNRLGLQQGSDDDDDEWVDVAQFSTPAVSAGKEIERLNLHPIDVIADFLSGVLKTTKMSIESSYEPEFVHLSKPFFVLAVPAIWSDRAKAHMVEAATKAGFGNHRVDFELIGEPEAAAAYTIKIIQPQELPIGTSFVVADIGGGTGDLICYSIRDLKPLRINESVVGDGDLCGSVYLDKAFEVYIRNLLGNKTIDNMNPRAKAEMMRTWTEKVKHSFGSGDSVEYEVTLASIKSDPAKRIEGGFHIMEPDDVARIFDPIVDRIIALVKLQVEALLNKNETVSAILLVGGFGSSPYLRDCLKNTWFKGKKIQVIQPPNALTAVARGALLRGMEGSSVGIQRARRFYGCKSAIRYVEGDTRTEQHKVWCDVEELYQVHGRMTWYIKKNQMLGEAHHAVSSFYRNLRTDADGNVLKSDLILHDKLWACDYRPAPTYQWEAPHLVYEVCTLVSDLNKAPKQCFIPWTNSKDVQYVRVNYEIEMVLSGELLRMELMIGGKSYGTVSTRFR